MGQKKRGSNYRGPKSKDSKWVRSGGAIGDDSMERLEKWAQDGCGVSEEETEVGTMPNEGIGLSPLKGRTR